MANNNNSNMEKKIKYTRGEQPKTYKVSQAGTPIEIMKENPLNGSEWKEQKGVRAAKEKLVKWKFMNKQSEC